MAIVVAALFFAVAVLHFGFMLRYKSARYFWPFLLGCFGEAAGYAVRRVSASHPTGRGSGLTFYIIQELFIILSPALLAVSDLCMSGRREG